MSTKRVFKVGSRESKLALIQSNYLVSKLQEHRPDIQFETVTMSTPGDRDLSQSIVKIGESALWTLELENSLKSGRVDMIVHSLKDVSTSLPHGLVLGSILERANPRDAIVMSPQNHGHTLATLPNGSVIGTSSLRRAAQIRRSYPHLKIYDIRGNIDGRMQKLDESGQYDGLCLAAAALERMGAEYEKRTSQILSPEECMYAVSQAALAVECRANDVDGLNLLDNLHHRDTALRVVAERAYQKRLKAGCSEPVGAHSILKDGVLTLKGAVFTADGKEAIFDEETIRLPNGIKDGTELYKNLGRTTGTFGTKSTEGIASSELDKRNTVLQFHNCFLASVTMDRRTATRLRECIILEFNHIATTSHMTCWLLHQNVVVGGYLEDKPCTGGYSFSSKNYWCLSR
ncbi:porphobilinogen deaminase-like isoform X2 [Haliotis rufescens]|uniref:porphobilinogen deaminase-like isoform X2 n=1 Tax=Haliotis rufescens TaxID=6454 RepID=UPI001EAFC13E|nr:porphobilinogen deaminase-like isoform X2 [Haliotis rufescens]